ncbi:DNA excision repair protein ERCC-1 [Morus notabilis]|uniref:DNA excision repair protein ERCC-1 n=1 Tax=Morus notabilis TaxID=981085 RepID=W9R7C9_9ROSA|nr:DNA excision repair protein ERCC-1 [Morus notabilis]EXB56542.1 DNA excision repair protein ERCC-1 [Morus notabilis]
MEEDGYDDRGKNTNTNTNTNTNKVVIKIPSYQEVLKTSQWKSTPPSLFAPSQTFSQAFAFVKSSEFYSPPPPSSTSAAASEITASRERQSNVPSSSSSASTSGLSSSWSSSSSSTQNRNAILVSHRQKGNPLLKHIRNVRWAFADVVCDYLLGQGSCALYLSLRYHLLHPDYLYYRIRELQKNFKLSVVLCHVDVEDVVKPLLEVTKTALLHDCTLLCGWSLEECGRYLETIKVYENKPADIIQGQMDTDYLSRLTHALTTVRHVNKTDVVTLGNAFGSLSHIMDASMEDLARCPGIGERKVKRLYDSFHEPFKRVVPSYPAVPETSTQNNAEVGSANEDKEAKEEKDREKESKRRKKEPQLTVKSALSAAFSKYADKVRKKNNKSQGEGRGETSAATEQEAENKNL